MTNEKIETTQEVGGQKIEGFLRGYKIQPLKTKDENYLLISFSTGLNDYFLSKASLFRSKDIDFQEIENMVSIRCGENDTVLLQPFRKYIFEIQKKGKYTNIVGISYAPEIQTADAGYGFKPPERKALSIHEMIHTQAKMHSLAIVEAENIAKLMQNHTSADVVSIAHGIVIQAMKILEHKSIREREGLLEGLK